MKDINKIIKDLYSLDPEFKNHEQELMRIIKDILESKPDTKFDKVFARKLRAQLLGEEPSQTHQYSILQNINNIINNMTNIYKYAGAVAVVVIVVAVGAYSTQRGSVKLAFTPEINKVESGAFGSLVEQDGEGTDQALADGEALTFNSGITPKTTSSIAAPIAGIGAGGGGGTPPVASAKGEGIASSEMADQRMIMPYPQTSFSFKYTGEDFTLEDTIVTVMRRKTGSDAGDAVVDQVKGINWGLLNLSSFSQAKMENISFKEDKDR